MFNLELAIETWKSSLRSHGSMTMENIAELETHLRAQMIDLQKLGLSEQESFGIATGRLGQTSELNYEYSKVNGSTIWRSRVYWMIAGSLVYCVAARLISATASITSTAISRMGAGPMAIGSTIVIVLGWTALLYLLYKQSTKPFAGPNRVSNRWVLTAAVTLLFSCIFGLGANIARVRMISLAEYGQFTLWMHTSNLVIQLCVLFAGCALMYMLREPKPVLAHVRH